MVLGGSLWSRMTSAAAPTAASRRPSCWWAGPPSPTPACARRVSTAAIWPPPAAGTWPTRNAPVGASPHPQASCPSRPAASMHPWPKSLAPGRGPPENLVHVQRVGGLVRPLLWDEGLRRGSAVGLGPHPSAPAAGTYAA